MLKQDARLNFPPHSSLCLLHTNGTADTPRTEIKQPESGDALDGRALRREGTGESDPHILPSKKSQAFWYVFRCFSLSVCILSRPNPTYSAKQGGLKFLPRDVLIAQNLLKMRAVVGIAAAAVLASSAEAFVAQVGSIF